MKIDLRISGIMYDQLFKHLYPGDGKEAVAIALCGRLNTASATKLLVHKIIFIPYDDCYERTELKVNWSTEKLIPLLEEATRKDFSILKVHSHPNGYSKFSSTDDVADKELFESIHAWIDKNVLHASAVMLPDGKMFGRAIDAKINFIPFSKILISGDEIKYHFTERDGKQLEEFSIRTAQAFGEGTTNLLRKLSVSVVGCSGTGSPVVEQLARLGFGKIVLVDSDIIEEKNLNRIINAKMNDAKEKRFKVEVLKEAIHAMGIDTEVEVYQKNVFDDIEVIKAIANSDLIFGCVDSVDGRHILNQISTFYLLPYFDLGVKLIADGKGNIEQIWSTINYLQPGGSSLMTRGVYTQDDLYAACLFRLDPKQYADLRKEGYIKNVTVGSPAVISVNMQVASLAVLEFLARVHKFRFDSNMDSAITRISLTDSYIQKEGEGIIDPYLLKFVGRGDIIPFLNMMEFNFQ